MRCVVGAMFVLFLASGCGAAGQTSPRRDAGGGGGFDTWQTPDTTGWTPDYGSPFNDSSAPGADGGGPQDSGTSPDTTPGCVTGTPDNCARCGDRCPGPAVATSTQRVCLSRKCDIQCLEEYYDVNGKTQDGCEAIDDLPVHNTETAAADMGKVSDCDKTKTESGVLPSDDRLHIKSPTDRKNGRPDYYKIYIEDDFGCSVSGKVSVNMGSHPSSASYRVEIDYICKGGKRTGKKSATISGGQTATLTPGTGCTTGSLGDDSGTVVISVTKLSGPHSVANYTVSVSP